MTTQRQRARAFVRAHPTFTIADIEAAGIGRSTAQNVVHELVRAGLVRAGEAEPGRLRGRVTRYEVVGEIPRQEAPPGGHQRMWTVMRIKRSFTVNDLLALAKVTRTNATTYVHRLVEAGVVRRDGRLQPSGHPGSYCVYRLVQDGGPRPPALPSKPRAAAGREVRHA